MHERRVYGIQVTVTFYEHQSQLDEEEFLWSHSKLKESRILPLLTDRNTSGHWRTEAGTVVPVYTITPRGNLQNLSDWASSEKPGFVSCVIVRSSRCLLCCKSSHGATPATRTLREGYRFRPTREKFWSATMKVLAVISLLKYNNESTRLCIQVRCLVTQVMCGVVSKLAALHHEGFTHGSLALSSIVRTTGEDTTEDSISSSVWKFRDSFASRTGTICQDDFHTGSKCWPMFNIGRVRIALNNIPSRSNDSNTKIQYSELLGY